MALFKKKYRVESARLKSWDYSWPGWYYVTINTQEHKVFFGEIKDGEMFLSPVGEIVRAEWIKAPQVRPYVDLDEWQIMPNHVHGIIIINDRPRVETTRRVVSTDVNDNPQGGRCKQIPLAQSSASSNPLAPNGFTTQDISSSVGSHASTIISLGMKKISPEFVNTSRTMFSNGSWTSIIRQIYQ